MGDKTTLTPTPIYERINDVIGEIDDIRAAAAAQGVQQLDAQLLLARKHADIARKAALKQEGGDVVAAGPVPPPGPPPSGPK